MFIAGTDPYLFATGMATWLLPETSHQSDIVQHDQIGDRIAVPNSRATQPASAQYVPLQPSNNERVASTLRTTAVGASRSSGQSAQSSQLATRPLSAQFSQLRSTASAIQSQLDNLEMQMENMVHDSRCCICLTGNHDCQLLPCMHNKFCKACLEQHLSRDNHCPVCRAAVRGMLTSFGG